MPIVVDEAGGGAASHRGTGVDGTGAGGGVGPPGGVPGLWRLVRLLCLAAAWLAALVSVVFDAQGTLIVDTGTCAFGAFIILTVARLRIDSLVILAVLGVVAWIILDSPPDMRELLDGGGRALVFAALLPTMALVRATAMKMPSVHLTQQRLARLPASAAAAGQQIAAHVFGGVINTGAFALMSAAVGPDAPATRRRAAAEAVIRGMVSSCVWSPFFIAFAIGQTFFAPQHAWTAIAIGVLFGLLFMGASLIAFAHTVSPSAIALALACLRPVALRLLLVLATVLGAALVFGLTALSAVIVVMPAFVALQLYRHREQARATMRRTVEAMHSMADDIVVITAAMLLAFLAARDAGIAALLGDIYQGPIPGWAALMITPLAMAVFSIFCIHPVITSTALLTIFAGGGSDAHPALLMQAHLIGWAAGTMSSIASLSVISCAGLYQVPARRLVFGDNLVAGLALAVVGGAVLALASLVV